MTRDEIIKRIAGRATSNEVAAAMGWHLIDLYRGCPPGEKYSAETPEYSTDCGSIDDLSEWLKKHGEAIVFTYHIGVWTASLLTADRTVYKAEAQTIAHAASLLVLMVHYDCKGNQ